MFASRGAMLITISVLVGLTLLPVTVIAAGAGIALLAFVPGRILLGPLGLERHWSAGGRAVLSLAVSLSVMPFALNIMWHLTHQAWAMRVIVWAAVALLVLLRHATRSPGEAVGLEENSPFFERAATRRMAGAVALIVFCTVVFTFWPTELLGYPIPAEMHDFVKHHAVLDSLERRPLPLGNLFYADGADVPVYYYHFFYLIPATVRMWTHHTLSIELAFGLGGALVGLATAGMVYAIAKRFTGGEGPASLAAVLVTVVGALDVIPASLYMLKRMRPVILLDCWIDHPYRVHNILNQMIWSPQNMSAVLMVLVGVYILSARGVWRGWFLLGPLLGASILASSVWVALGALPGLALWVVTRPRRIPSAAVVALLMVAVSLPTIRGYMHSSERHDHSLTAEWPGNPTGTLGRLVEPGILANFLDLPVRVALEFGAGVLFLPLVGLVWWRRMWDDEGLRWLCLTAAIGLLALCTVRSTLRHNDLGQKIIMLTTIFGALMAGCAVAPQMGRPRWWNPLGWRLGWAGGAGRGSGGRAAGAMMGAVLLLGLPMGLYEAPMMAVRRYPEEMVDPTPADEQAALRFMRHELPASAVVQAEGSEERARLAQRIRRQIGVMEPQDDVLVFDPPDYEKYLTCVDEVLGTLRGEASPEQTHTILNKHKITHVFIGSVERRAWTHLERFDDTAYFADAFRQGPTRVVRLLPTGPPAD